MCPLHWTDTMRPLVVNVHGCWWLMFMNVRVDAYGNIDYNIISKKYNLLVITH
jgi:hypothetical protein